MIITTPDVTDVRDGTIGIMKTCMLSKDFRKLPMILKKIDCRMLHFQLQMVPLNLLDTGLLPRTSGHSLRENQF